MIRCISPRPCGEDSERRRVLWAAMKNCSLIVSVLRQGFLAITGVSMQRIEALDKYTGNPLDILISRPLRCPVLSTQAIFGRGLGRYRRLRMSSAKPLAKHSYLLCQRGFNFASLAAFREFVAQNMHDGWPSGRAGPRELCGTATFRYGKRPILGHTFLLDHKAGPSRLTPDPQRIIPPFTRFFLPKVRVGLQIEFDAKMQVEIDVLEWIVDGARDKT
jgi:hypothetical protein